MPKIRICSQCSRPYCKAVQVPASSQTANSIPWRLLMSLTSEAPNSHGYQSKISFPQKEKWQLELSRPLCMRLESDINMWYHTEPSQPPRRSRGHIVYQYGLAGVKTHILNLASALIAMVQIRMKTLWVKTLLITKFLLGKAYRPRPWLRGKLSNVFSQSSCHF